MSLELVNTFATLGTFLVIAATAVVAIVQLGHYRAGLNVSTISELRETMESAEFRAAVDCVQGEFLTKIREPEFRYQIANRSLRNAETRAILAKVVAVGNFYESLGVLLREGWVERRLVLRLWDGLIVTAWQHLTPFVAIRRRSDGNGLWEEFEYLTVLAQEWLDAHPGGTYPSGMRRLALADEWLETDREYAAARPTA